MDTNRTRLPKPCAVGREGSGTTGEAFADSVGLNLNRYSLPLDCRQAFL